MVIVNQKPMTMGRIWSTNKQGRRFLTHEAQRFKSQIGNIALKAFPELIRYEKEIGFEAVFYGNWYRKKDGAISKTAGDLDNFNKLILDGIGDALRFNDCQVFHIDIKKSSLKVETAYLFSRATYNFIKGNVATTSRESYIDYYNYLGFNVYVQNNLISTKIS